ncbi:MAG: glycine/D-amino acid oxidase-like deaminating enzyme [Gammaproteobacteria bacterium]|jgi:glycine/D-amino acid oxidase-like deaminating enzyme
MTYSFQSRDFKNTPFWWDGTPRPAESVAALPEYVDVLIIGSGYTGLNCALQTARAGCQTLVIDAESAGWGCSARNGGQISGEIKPGYEALSRKHGIDTAKSLIGEARNALSWLKTFIEEESIDCDLRQCGRFVAAHSPRQFKQLAHSIENQPKGLEQPLRLVSKAEQGTEIDSPFYHGGLVIDQHCSLDPARYHQGLLQKSIDVGVEIVSHCRADQIDKRSDGFTVTTTKGKINCRDLVIATSGYTGNVSPWQQRRIVPIGSYMLATEALPAERAQALMPKDRVFSDTRKVVVYFRRSPDGNRVVFGGRVSVFESDPEKSLPALRAELLRIFPQLEDVKISHSWMGFVGYTFDNLPHLGVQDGIHYAMGYCGSGICLASFMGNRIGQQLLGKPEGKTAFDQIGFQTRPLYSGKPWFLGAAVRYYQLLDKLR